VIWIPRKRIDAVPEKHAAIFGQGMLDRFRAGLMHADVYIELRPHN
jgi:hypothetical protein